MTVVNLKGYLRNAYVLADKFYAFGYDRETIETLVAYYLENCGLKFDYKVQSSKKVVTYIVNAVERQFLLGIPTNAVLNRLGRQIKISLV